MLFSQGKSVLDHQIGGKRGVENESGLRIEGKTSWNQKKNMFFRKKIETLTRKTSETCFGGVFLGADLESGLKIAIGASFPDFFTFFDFFQKLENLYSRVNYSGYRMVQIHENQ